MHVHAANLYDSLSFVSQLGQPYVFTFSERTRSVLSKGEDIVRTNTTEIPRPLSTDSLFLEIQLQKIFVL